MRSYQGCDIGLRGGSDSTPEGVRSLPAAAGPAPAPPQPVPEMPLPDVKSGEDISPAERAKLDKEVEAYALEMEAFWKVKADARDWDSVRANLEVYALEARRPEDPRRTRLLGTSCGKALRSSLGRLGRALRLLTWQLSKKSCGVRLRASGRRALPGLLSGSSLTTVSLQVRPSPLSPTP